MRNAGIVLAAASAGLFLLGCDSGGEAAGTGGEASGILIDAPAIPLSYENGHSLSEPSEDRDVLAMEAEVVRLVNAHRVSQGLNALVDSPGIRGVARAHSKHMIDHRFVGHVNPEGLGPGDRLAWAGIAWEHAGEDVAAGYATPQEVFDAWMASPGHKVVLEGPLWTHAGAGYVTDPSPDADFPFVHYWTMKFLKP